MNRYYLQVYGCQMNQYDAGLVRALLDGAGFVETGSEDDADCLLMLTCAVRSSAESRALGRLAGFRAAARKRPGRVVAVLGCLSEATRRSLIEERGADVVLGPDQYRQLPGALAEARKAMSHYRMQIADSGSPNREEVDTLHSAFCSSHSAITSECYEGILPRVNGSVRGSVTVMRGCDNWCSYCIVPLTRGRERSRALGQVLDEARALAASGVLDLTLLGQNVLAYQDRETGFVGLLEAVAALGAFKRIRFLTSHPKDFGERVARAMADIPAVCPDLHLPVQSGSDRILELMNRGYTRTGYLERVETARAVLPGLGLTTDVLVGFPGESEDDFLATLDLVRQVRFDAAYMFRYSVRTGTAAEKMGPKVSEAEAGRRLARLIEAQNRITREKNRELVGRRLELLVEAPASRGRGMMGRTRSNRTVIIESPVPIGQTVSVEVTGIRGWTPIADGEDPRCHGRRAPGIGNLEPFP